MMSPIALSSQMVGDSLDEIDKLLGRSMEIVQEQRDKQRHALSRLTHLKSKPNLPDLTQFSASMTNSMATPPRGNVFDPNDKPRAAGPELDVGTLALLRKSDNLLKTLARRRLDSPTNAEEDGNQQSFGKLRGWGGRSAKARANVRPPASPIRHQPRKIYITKAQERRMTDKLSRTVPRSERGLSDKKLKRRKSASPRRRSPTKQSPTATTTITDSLLPAIADAVKTEKPLLNPFGCALTPHWNLPAYRRAIQTFWTGKRAAAVLNAASRWLPGMAHPPEPTTVKRLVPLLDRAICRVVLVAKLGEARDAATAFVGNILTWDVCESGGQSKVIDKLKLLRVLESSGIEPSLVSEILNCARPTGKGGIKKTASSSPGATVGNEGEGAPPSLDIRTMRCAMANTKWHCNAHYQRELLAAMGDPVAADELEKARRALHNVRILSPAVAQARLENAVTRRTDHPEGGTVTLTRSQKKRAKNKRQATMLLSQSRLLALKHLLDAMAKGTKRTLYTQSINTFKKVFRAMDRDGNGRLEPAELREALIRLRLLDDNTRPASAAVSGPKPSKNTDSFLILWRFLDPENVGFIHYTDFEAGLKQVRQFVDTMDNKEEVMEKVAAAEEAIAARQREKEQEQKRKRAKVKRGHAHLKAMGKYGLAAIHYLRHIVPMGDHTGKAKTRTLFGVPVRDAQCLFEALSKAQGPSASVESKILPYWCLEVGLHRLGLCSDASQTLNSSTGSSSSSRNLMSTSGSSRGLLSQSRGSSRSLMSTQSFRGRLSSTTRSRRDLMSTQSFRGRLGKSKRMLSTTSSRNLGFTQSQMTAGIDGLSEAVQPVARLLDKAKCGVGIRKKDFVDVLTIGGGGLEYVAKRQRKKKRQRDRYAAEIRWTLACIGFFYKIDEDCFSSRERITQSTTLARGRMIEKFLVTLREKEHKEGYIAFKEIEHDTSTEGDSETECCYCFGPCVTNPVPHPALPFSDAVECDTVDVLTEDGNLAGSIDFIGNPGQIMVFHVALPETDPVLDEEYSDEDEAEAYNWLTARKKVFECAYTGNSNGQLFAHLDVACDVHGFEINDPWLWDNTVLGGRAKGDGDTRNEDEQQHNQKLPSFGIFGMTVLDVANNALSLFKIKYQNTSKHRRAIESRRNKQQADLGVLTNQITKLTTEYDAAEQDTARRLVVASRSSDPWDATQFAQASLQAQLSLRTSIDQLRAQSTDLNAQLQAALMARMGGQLAGGVADLDALKAQYSDVLRAVEVLEDGLFPAVEALSAEGCDNLKTDIPRGIKGLSNVNKAEELLVRLSKNRAEVQAQADSVREQLQQTQKGLGRAAATANKALQRMDIAQQAVDDLVGERFASSAAEDDQWGGYSRKASVSTEDLQMSVKWKANDATTDSSKDSLLMAAMAKVHMGGLPTLLAALNQKRSLFGTSITDIRSAFDAMDRDGNGKLEKEEFRRCCQRLGFGLSSVQLDQLFRYLDANGDGVVSFQEFEVTLLTAKGALAEDEETDEVNAFLDTLDAALPDPHAQAKVKAEKDKQDKARAKEKDDARRNKRQFMRSMQRANMGGLPALLAAMSEKRSLFGTSINDIHSAFEAMDRDGSKTLGKEEFCKCCHRLDLGLLPAQLDKLFHFMDINGDESIDFQEFEFAILQAKKIAVMGAQPHEVEEFLEEVREQKEKLQRDRDRHEWRVNQFANLLDAIGLKDWIYHITVNELHALFGSLDRDGDGHLSAEEFSQCAGGLGGVKLTLEQARELVVFLDQDGDRKVSIEEFEKMLTGLANYQFRNW